jgi:hypothetical protein
VEGARRHKVQVLTGSGEHKALGGSDATAQTVQGEAEATPAS